MTRQDAKRRLDKLTDDDPESAHGRAEDIICQFLKDNGFGDVAEAFEAARDRVGFWYS